MKRLAVIQPHLSNASREMFLELARYCPLDLVVSPEPAGMGFRVAPIPEGSRVRCFSAPTFMPFGGKFGWIQWGVVNYMVRERPEAIFLNANPRYLSFWIALLWAKLLGIPAYVHGHGFYRRGRIGAPYKLMMMAMLKLVSSYICYAAIVRQAFLDNGFSPQKLAVAPNSLVNPFPVLPREKTGMEPGVLFIGRLRRASGLDLLVTVIERIRREDGLPLRLHVVGDGEEGGALRARAWDRPWVVLHGQVYDPKKIREISLDCFLGCYPGNAGLSVVHMMSLSLPVVTHNDLNAHGPEPSFIRDGVSGVLYDHADPDESLYQALRSLASDPARVFEMRRNAFADYQSLAHPSLAERLWGIIGGEENPQSANVPGRLAPTGAGRPGSESAQG
jgi:glycosyltransferase involved in cell wall biosynthesis